MESAKLDRPIASYMGPKNPEVGRIGWSNDTVWLDAPATKKRHPATLGTSGFRGVREDVWNFQIGGYQVCEKWLKGRKGRTLSEDDIAHYQKIIVALSETIGLMKEIDEVIDRHGGWPGAFVCRSQAAEEEAACAESRELETIPVAAVASSFPPSDSPMAMAAENPAVAFDAEPPESRPTERVEITDLEKDDLVALARQVFVEAGDLDRADAIAEMAQRLGYQRTGARIREELDNVLRTAVRRGVLINEAGKLRVLARTVDQYERPFLKEQFLASLPGRNWIDRDEAVRGFGRWMGFKRTGPIIDETARSLINGLQRDGSLERNGSDIRRVG